MDFTEFRNQKAQGTTELIKQFSTVSTEFSTIEEKGADTKWQKSNIS